VLEIGLGGWTLDFDIILQDIAFYAQAPLPSVHTVSVYNDEGYSLEYYFSGYRGNEYVDTFVCNTLLKIL
jgi:hypothetical protein